MIANLVGLAFGMGVGFVVWGEFMDIGISFLIPIFFIFAGGVGWVIIGPAAAIFCALSAVGSGVVLVLYYLFFRRA